MTPLTETPTPAGAPLSRVCRVCESNRVEHLFTVRGSELDRCTRCRLVQVRAEPTAEEIARMYCREYFDHGKYGDSVAQQREHNKRIELMHRAGVERGARVLEVGCATGEFLSFVGDRFEMSGMDVSSDAVEMAREKNPRIAANIHAGFVEDIELEAESFDAIVMWDVVEHLWDPVSVCRRLAALLKPGGCLLLSTPDIGAVIARLMASRWAFMTPPEHLCFFSEPSMTWLLDERLGFDVIHSTSTGKWVNCAFLVYKLGRVFPRLVPQGVVRTVARTPLARMVLYVPTRDIQYVTAQKRRS